MRGTTNDRPRCRRAGFTLFELVLVITIIAALAALAVVPFASTLARHTVDSLAQRVASDIEHARKQARIHGATQSIEFDTMSESYELVDITSLDRSDKSYIVNVDAAPYDGDIVTVTAGGDTTLKFDPFGRPDSAAIITIEVHGQRRRISVSANVGTVTISEVAVAGGGGSL